VAERCRYREKREEKEGPCESPANLGHFKTNITKRVRQILKILTTSEDAKIVKLGSIKGSLRLGRIMRVCVRERQRDREREREWERTRGKRGLREGRERKKRDRQTDRNW
jgi:hypothetical protein